MIQRVVDMISYGYYGGIVYSEYVRITFWIMKVVGNVSVSTY